MLQTVVAEKADEKKKVVICLVSMLLSWVMVLIKLSKKVDFLKVH